MTAPAPSPAERPDPQTLRGPDYPFPGAPPAEVADYVQRRLRESEADAIARYKIAARNLLFTDGRQHIDWNLQQRAWLEMPSAPGQVRTTANYIRPILRSRLSRILSGDFVWRAVPMSNADDDRDQASVAENLLTFRWDALQMDNRLRYALWLAFSCGSAYLKSFWNPNLGNLVTASLKVPGPGGELVEIPVDAEGNPVLGEDGNPGKPDLGYRYRQGDTDCAVRSLFNIRVNPDAYGLDVAEGFRWLIDSEVVPRTVVQERYGVELKGTMAQETKQQGVFERLVRSVGQVFAAGSSENERYTAASSPETDTALLSEYWEPASDTLPEGRLIVLANHDVLFDGPLPHGIVPYTPIYDERRPFDAAGRGTVNDLIAPQRTVNRMLGLILQELRAEGTGQWVGFDLNGVFDQLSNEANTHVKVPWNTQTASIGLDQLIKQMPHRSINAAWLEMYRESKAQMFDIGAFHEIQRGQVPPGVDSGVAVQHLMEAENAQLHDTVRTLKQGLISFGRQQLHIARWGYGEDEQRWIRVNRDDMGYTVEDMSGSDLPDPDMIDIDVEGLEPRSRAAQRADILSLMEKQLLAPSIGMQMLDLGRGIEGVYESQTRHYAKARTENLAFERGEVVVIQPPDGSLPLFFNQDQSPLLLSKDDAHELHIERHQELALDASKPWPIRQLVLAHIESHRQAMDMQMMEAAMKAGAMQPPSAGQPQGAPQ